MTRRRCGPAVGLWSACCAGAALAQTAPAPTIPGLDDYTLPSARATPSPTPTPAPTTRAPEPPVPRPTPTPLARPLEPPAAVPVGPAVVVPPPRPTATPLRRAVPTPAPRPAPSPQPSARTPPPAHVPPAPASAAAPARSTAGDLTVAAVALLAVLALGGVLAWRRRRRSDRAGSALDFDAEPVLPAPVAPLPPVAPAPAMLEVGLTVRRAGTNLLSAAVEYRLTIRNTGPHIATAVRLDVRLFGAGPQQDAILAALSADPLAQPVTAPFDLPPGGSVTLDGMAMHPKDTLAVLDVAGSALFVPVLAVNLRYGEDGRAARAFMVGMTGAGAKLQPFRRDGARMHDAVAVLEYGVAG